MKTKGYIPNFYRADSIADVQEFLSDFPEGIILGRGSNVVISDRLEQPVLQLSMCDANRIDTHKFELSAGMGVSQVMQLLVKQSLSNLEFCAGVPASVGGMLTMNFGCWGAIYFRLRGLCSNDGSHGGVLSIRSARHPFWVP